MGGHRLGKGWNREKTLNRTPERGKPNRLVFQSGRKHRLRQLEPDDQLPPEFEQPRGRFPTAFGLMPLAVPYDDSPPELRILNAISAGLLFEGRREPIQELGLTKPEFVRALRALKTTGAIHVGPGGRYRISFDTSNFPNITLR